MAPPCDIRTSALAQEFCQHLTDPQNGYGVTALRLDEGTPQVQFQKTGQKAPKDFFTRIVVKGGGDGHSSVPEVYKTLVELAPRQPKLAAFMKGKLENPWIPSTHQKISEDEKKLDEWMEKKITSLKGQLKEKGLEPGQFAYTLAMGQGLFEAIVGNHAGQLGVVSDEDLNQPEKSLGEIYRQRKANCLEFTLLYFWAARKADIEVVPVASYRDILGAIQDHVMVGFKNPQTKNIEKVADIGFKRFGDPIPQEVWGEIPSLELWAQWLNAQGWSGMDKAQAEAYVDRALEMVPDHFLFLYNKGFYRLQAKDFAAAKDFFLASIRVNPNYPPNYQNLNSAALSLGDERLARWAKAKFDALPENKDKVSE